jgi:hypothetical protein
VNSALPDQRCPIATRRRSTAILHGRSMTDDAESATATAIPAVAMIGRSAP